MTAIRSRRRVAFGIALVAASLSLTAAQVAAPAAPSPVGAWRSPSGQVYRLVAIEGGYELQAGAGYLLKNRCPVHTGETVSRFLRIRSDFYREQVDLIHPGTCVRWSCGRCADRWQTVGTVRITISRNRLTISCPGKTNHTCTTFTRAG